MKSGVYIQGIRNKGGSLPLAPASSGAPCGGLRYPLCGGGAPATPPAYFAVEVRA